MLTKTQVLGIMLSLFSTSLYASFYVGAGVGPESVDFQEKQVSFIGSALSGVNAAHISGTGAFGTLFGGYQYNHKRFYLAGELNANLSSAESEATTRDASVPGAPAASVYFKMRESYGASIIPGFLLSDATLFFARLGYINGRLSISSADESIKGFNANLSGVRFGAGIKQAITKKCAVRLEYSQANYESHTSQAINTNGVVTIDNTTIAPQTGQVEFGLVYDLA